MTKLLTPDEVRKRQAAIAAALVDRPAEPDRALAAAERAGRIAGLQQAIAIVERNRAAVDSSIDAQVLAGSIAGDLERALHAERTA